MWRATKADYQKLDTFHRACLRRILRVIWPRIVSNSDLHQETGTHPLSGTIRCRWKWIGHLLRRESNNIARTALTWAPEGKRRKGRPRQTWRRKRRKGRPRQTWRRKRRKGRPRQTWKRTVEKERLELVLESWPQATHLAGDRERCRKCLSGLKRLPGTQRMSE